MSIPLGIYGTRNSPIIFSSYTRTRTVQPAGLASTFGVRRTCLVLSLRQLRLAYALDSQFCLYLSSGTRTGKSIFSSGTRTGKYFFPSGARTEQSVLSLLFVWRTYWTVSFVFTFRLAHVLDRKFCLYFSSGTRTGQSVLSLLFVWRTYWTVNLFV